MNAPRFPCSTCYLYLSGAGRLSLLWFLNCSPICQFSYMGLRSSFSDPAGKWSSLNRCNKHHSHYGGNCCIVYSGHLAAPFPVSDLLQSLLIGRLLSLSSGDSPLDSRTGFSSCFQFVCFYPSC